jgi:hypothetical protein
MLLFENCAFPITFIDILCKYDSYNTNQSLCECLGFVSSVAKAIVLLRYEAVSLGNWFRAFRDTALVSKFGIQKSSDTASKRRRKDKTNRDYFSVMH